jgi:acetyl-CoA C-acetyltransferase
MTGVQIVAARRSALAPSGGALARLRIEDLAAPVVAAVLADAGIAPDEVDEIVVSNALGAGGNPARRVALAAGLPLRVAGLSIDRQCCGGLDALMTGAALVAAGLARVVVAGGVESHSLRPWRAARGPGGGAAVPYEQAPFTPWPDRDPDMAEAAGRLAARLGLGAERAAAYAMAAHARALAAGPLPEIVALAGCAADPYPRRMTAALAARAPALAGPAVTVATTAVAADGAAFVVLAGREWRGAGGRSTGGRGAGGRGAGGLRILAGATRGADPAEPGLAPLPAIAEALARARLAPRDLAEVALMEAYAVQAIACIEAAGLDPARVNPAGGLLARGHAIGASGAALAVRLWQARPPGPALAAIAGAGGIGTAVVLTPG